MKKCENCSKEHNGSFASGRFCCKKCSRAFSTKAKRKEINEKVSKKLTIEKKSILKICPICNKEFYTIHKNICCSIKCGSIYGGKNSKKSILLDKKTCKECNKEFQPKRQRQIFCSVKCARDYKFKDPIFIEKISQKLKLYYSIEENRKNLRDIGRKGGFGKRGYTKNKTHYESNLEKQCFEWLEENNVKFIPHKYIPNSSKISDIYLIDKDLWIELDGINREKKKEWLGQDYQYWLDKLKIYEQNNLKYKIIYNLTELIREV